MFKSFLYLNVSLLKIEIFLYVYVFVVEMENNNSAVTGMNYLELLFENNKALLINYSSYCTVISGLKKRMGYDISSDFLPDSSVLEEIEINNMSNLVSQIKFYVISISKILTAIRPFLNKNLEKNWVKENPNSDIKTEIAKDFSLFQEKYNSIKNSLMPSVDDIDSFLDYVNKYIVVSTVEDIFQNKLNDLRAIYGGEKKQS